MGMISEFKEFAVKGNMVDMAVGIIIGGAFGTIVKSLVDDVIMPPIGYLSGGLDFSNLALSLGQGVDGKEVLIKYGTFMNSVIAFLIVAFVLFMIIKGINKAKATMESEKQEEEAAAEPPKQEVLLEEIRDLLKSKA
ncbi:large-conductance mechanosensitive channel protein MscL [Thiolapillus sp.]